MNEDIEFSSSYDECEEKIAEVLIDKLELPPKGYMFGPHEAGYLDPFPHEADGQFFFCPYCRKTPFYLTEEIAQAWSDGKGKGPVEILTDMGLINLNDVIAPQYKCEVCGKPFKNKQAYYGHKRTHKPKKEKAVNG